MAIGILRKKLPPNMKSDFWQDFIDVIEEESEEYKAVIAEKKEVYNIDKMNYARLLEVADLLNVPFDVSVIGTEDFLRSEIKSIPFRIAYKATVKLYLSFFLALERTGFIYLYYWSGSSLIRHSENFLANINGVDPSLPYYIRSKMNFSSFLTEAVFLDSELDLDTSWNLDNRSLKTNTKHLALEIYLDQYFFGEEAGLAPSDELAPSNTLAPITKIKYLMRPKYFSYLRTNLEISKKATEVIHVGAQLCLIGDNSRYYDSKGLEYTMPLIASKVVTTDNMTLVSTVADMKYIAFGIDRVDNLPYVGSVESQPTALIEKIAKIEIFVEDKYEDANWYGVNATYIGNLINDVIIGTGDGTTDTFNYTLPYAPLKPGNVRVQFTSGAIKYIVDDDYYGHLVGSNAAGTIDYTTGDIVLNTVFYKEAEENIGTGDGTDLTFSKTLGAANVPVQTNSFSVRYIINGTTLVAVDNGAGVVTGSNCTGTINYVTGAVALTFAVAPADTTSIQAYFKHQITSIPDDETPITIEYYFIGGETEISEAGIYDNAGHLLAYAEFPKINFDSFYNHLNLTFLIKKSNF